MWWLLQAWAHHYDFFFCWVNLMLFYCAMYLRSELPHMANHEQSIWLAEKSWTQSRIPSALVIFVYSVKSSHIHNQPELYERTMEGKMNTWNLRRWLHLCILTFLLLSPPSSPHSPHTSTLLKSISALRRPWDSIIQPSFLSSSFFSPPPAPHPGSPLVSQLPLPPHSDPQPRYARCSPPFLLSFSPLTNKHVWFWFNQASLTSSHLSPHFKPCCLSSATHFKKKSLFMFHLRSENFKQVSLKGPLAYTF